MYLHEVMNMKKQKAMPMNKLGNNRIVRRDMSSTIQNQKNLSNVDMSMSRK